MGHEIVHETYPENVNKQKVQAEWDAAVRRICYQEGASGLGSPIRWLDKVCESYDDAMEYIRQKDKGWYDQLAVKYLDYGGIQPNKKMMELQERVKTLYAAYIGKSGRFHFADAQAAYITCKGCGSKISRTHLKGNQCPVCRADMRPDSTLKSIQSAKASYEKAQAALKVEEKKHQEKCKKQAKVRWLVKVEYHV